MSKRVSIILISIVLISFFVLPTTISAQNASWPLNEKETENFLDIIRKEPLTKANRELFDESLSHLFSDYPRKTGAVVLIKQAILNEQFNYWFKKAPKELSIKFIKTSLKLIELIYAQDISTIIKIIEKFTVEKATEYATNWFVQNEIKIGTGEASYTFTSYKGNSQKIDIQYIVVYKPISQIQGEIIAEFYSKNPIEPPIGTSPNALVRPTDDPKTTCWTWDRWLENERKRDNDEKLEPFIVRVKGYVKKNNWENYEWDKNKEKPIVEVDFDNPVPEIEESDVILENPPSKTSFFIEIIKSFGEKLKSGLSEIKDFGLDKWKIVKYITGNLAEKIKSYISSLRLGAQIVTQEAEEISSSLLPPKKEVFEEEVASLLEVIEEEISRIEDLEETQITLDELIEIFDDISEEAEIVLVQAEEFLTEESPSQIEEDGMPEEDVEEESAEEVPEEEEEEFEEEEPLKEEEEKAPEEEIILCSLSSSQSPVRNRVIFNEIAWMGTTNSSADEWIELKNISGNPINLAGWQILDKAAIENKSGVIKIIFENTTSETGGFLLLERTDDSTVSNIAADLIYTGALSNTDEALYLFDKDCNLQDKVTANPYWLAGNNDSKKTMERKNDFGWQTSSNINGTPKAENSSGEVQYVGGGGGGGPSDSDQEESSSPTPTFSPVFINEIMYDLEENDENREWIEIFNAATTSVDLSRWKFYENETNHNLTLVQGSSTLPPNGYAIIADKSEEFLKDFPEYSGILFDSSFSLNNTGESLAIKNGELLIDQVDYSSDWGANGDGNSLQKIDSEASSNDPKNWKPASPTPGKVNSFPKENQLPIAQFNYSPENPQVDGEILFDATSSTDPDGQITFYAWDFGDGTTTTTNQAIITYIFTTSSEFQVSLVVIDNQGATSTSATTILEVTGKSLPKPKLAQNVVITEVQINDKEFVELYNPTEEAIPTIGWFLSYFSKNDDWNKPQRNWEFPATTTISAKSYYLIGIFGYPEEDGNPDADWQVLTKKGEPYSQQQLSNEEGAIGIFSCDPSTSTTEAVKNCKIDALGWGEVEVKEENSAPTPAEGKSLTRKRDENGDYLDNNNNSTDFEIKNLTPTNSKGEIGNILPPQAVDNFQIASYSDNIVTLSWSTTTDLDTPQEDISYILYYSQEEITEENATTTTPNISSTSTSSTTLTFSGLYYNKTYYFGIRAFDGFYYSLVATTSHSTPLPSITDLNTGASANREAIDLFWNSPGPKNYLIKYAEKEIVESGANENQINWENAISIANSMIPKESGQIEILTVENLIPNKIYYFAVKSTNQLDAISVVSNSDKAKTLAGFQNNNDGTITDLYTQLVWAKDGTGLASNNGELLNWQEAKDFCNNLVLCNNGTFVTSNQSTSTCSNFGGMKYDDWRLPNYKELSSIINYNKNAPTIYENYFINTISNSYWTSSYKFIPGIAYAYPESWKIRIIDFDTGVIKFTTDKNANNYIRAVRGPDVQDILPVAKMSGDTTGCNLGLQNNGNETVTDLCTNLIWTKNNISGIGYVDPVMPGEEGVVWEKAIEVAESSNFAGYNDWRLPNVRELVSIAGISSGNNVQWSSTPDYFNSNNRWFVNLWSNPGISNPVSKPMLYYVRLVRDTD